MYFLMNCSPVSLRELAVRGSSGHAAGERPEDQSQHLHAAVPAGGKKFFFSVPPSEEQRCDEVDFLLAAEGEFDLHTVFTSEVSVSCCNQGKRKNRVTPSNGFSNLTSFTASDGDCLPFSASFALLSTQKVYTKAHSPGSRALCDITKCICSCDNNAGGIFDPPSLPSPLPTKHQC